MGQIKNYTIGIKSNISVFTLNVNKLNNSMKKSFSDLIKNKNPSLNYEIQLNFKNKC